MNDINEDEFNWNIEQRLLALSGALDKRVSLSRRVLAELDLSQQPQDGGPIVTSRFNNPFGEWTMFQKISAFSVAASVTLVAALWLVSSAGSASFAQVIDNVRQATSYEADVRMGSLTEVEGNKAPMTGKYYWRLPQDVRMETHGPRDRESINIYFDDHKGLELDAKSKTYRVASARSGVVSPIMRLQNLSKLKDVALKHLGEKEINGRKSDGFMVAISAIDANAGDGTLTVWVNRKTQLPESVAMEMKVRQASYVMALENIVWNKDLDETLFSTEPPQGYTLRKPTNVRSDAEKLAWITDALRAFAVLNDGKYPQVNMIYGDVTQAKMLELGGFADGTDGGSKTDVSLREIKEATRGWGTMNKIMRENPTAKYNGLDVGPEDADKILFRWKKTDGSTQAIYGDLRTATFAE